MSWPALACASAAPVTWRFAEVKSAVTSTLFFSAQAATCFCITGLACGTQWSQKPTESLPAAPAVRMCTNGNAAAAAPSLSAPRRETFPVLVIPHSPFVGPGAAV